MSRYLISYVRISSMTCRKICVNCFRRKKHSACVRINLEAFITIRFLFKFGSQFIDERWMASAIDWEIFIIVKLHGKYNRTTDRPFYSSIVCLMFMVSNSSYKISIFMSSKKKANSTLRVSGKCTLNTSPDLLTSRKLNYFPPLPTPSVISGTTRTVTVAKLVFSNVSNVPLSQYDEIGSINTSPGK